MERLIAAVVQMTVTDDVHGNAGSALASFDEALDRRANLVVFPENCIGIGTPEQRRSWAFDPRAPERASALAPWLAASAGTDTVVVLGGVPELAPDGGTYNTALVLQRGRILARYRKIHLFDAELSDGTRHGESAYTQPGATPVVVATDHARIGLSICYDVRFPNLYQRLVDAGAEVLLVPAAFTVPTGAAHWEALLRARAIETQCFVLAPAQQGEHGGGRRSYGHSMIVDPWGVVVARAADGPRVLTARLEPHDLLRARRQLAVLRHRQAAIVDAPIVVDLRRTDRER